MSITSLIKYLDLGEDISNIELQAFMADNVLCVQQITRPYDTCGNRFHILVIYMKGRTTLGFKSYNPSSINILKDCYKLDVTLQLTPKNFKSLEKSLKIFEF